jgi:hypothetical protein
MNCNIHQGQRCCAGGDSLAAQQKFANRTKFRFVTAERDMYEAMDTDHYRYVIVLLRRSKFRCLSHYKHMYRSTRSNRTFADWWGLQPDNFCISRAMWTRLRKSPKASNRSSTTPWIGCKSLKTICLLRALKGILRQVCWSSWLDVFAITRCE